MAPSPPGQPTDDRRDQAAGGEDMHESIGSAAPRVLEARRGRQQRKERPMPSDDDLTRWICTLRDRLGRGDLRGVDPIELGHGTAHLPGVTTVRIMLADLADIKNPAGSWNGDDVWRNMRHRSLLDDFRRLRELLG